MNYMKYQFTVNKMSCEHCKGRVHDALLAINGVDKVDIDLGTGSVSVECSGEIGLDVFATAIEEEGYIFVWSN
ncbi:MAG: heavy-metal-associated domain-containing protein [Clostridiales bacterium]|nr:heavy-metal-associated domain-containing protein [Clostridiales bacterium]